MAAAHPRRRPRYGFERQPSGTAHYECTCYHPLFVFNQFGDLERCAEVYGYLEGEGIKYAIRRNLFADIPRLIAELRPPPATSTA
jgi:hypothetical protein